MNQRFPELNNFGSLLRFAIELEKAASQIFKNSSGLCEDATKRVFEDLAREHARRASLLETVRQQNLNEMILEPIADLSRDDYPVEEWLEKVSAQLSVESAQRIEEISRRFYLDSSEKAKSVLAEAARTFEKLGKENVTFFQRLAGL